MAELAMFLPTDGENVKEALATHKQEAQLMLTTGSTLLAVNEGQQT